MLTIEYKNEQIFKNATCVAWHPTLVEVLMWIEKAFKPVITSAYRKGDPGVHGADPLRAFDLRSYIFTNPESVRDIINEHWVYDPKRPAMQVCVYHDVGRGVHFHVQVHKNSRPRREL